MTFWCLGILLVSHSSVKVLNSFCIFGRSEASIVRGRLKSIGYSHVAKRKTLHSLRVSRSRILLFLEHLVRFATLVDQLLNFQGDLLLIDQIRAGGVSSGFVCKDHR